MDPKWFARSVAYTIAKYGMSMCALGMSEELREDGIAVNTLWPRTSEYSNFLLILLVSEEDGDILRFLDFSPNLIRVHQKYTTGGQKQTDL